VALVLVLAPWRRDVGVPTLRHSPPSQLDGALVERRLELQQEQGLFQVEDASHWLNTLAACRCADVTICRSQAANRRAPELCKICVPVFRRSAIAS
jgi:hypothetical protein